MSNQFNAVNPADLSANAIKLIGKDWMLITSGNLNSYNMMTASWGAMGMLWNKPVVFIFIRPQRYTYEFVEQNELFTCCFFDGHYRKALNFCGSHSGRDVDKAVETSLHPVISPLGSVIFEEARLFFECRKISQQDIDPKGFLSPDIQKNYPAKDYHRMYIGEITFCGIKDE